MSLYHRGKSWYYDFWHQGERYRGCLGPITKTLAKEMLARKKAEAAEGRYQSLAKKPSPRLEAFVEDYFAYYQANRRPRSVRRHLVSWHAIQSVLGHKRLEEIAPFDLERLPQRPETARQERYHHQPRAGLSAASLQHGMTWGTATDNPVKKVRFARETNGRMRLLAPEEEQWLLAYCSPPLHPLVTAALHTGFRASELLSLT